MVTSSKSLDELIDLKSKIIFWKSDSKKSVTAQVLLFGGALRSGFRKWYNPVRWFRGDFYVEYISPERIYK